MAYLDLALGMTSFEINFLLFLLLLVFV